MPVNKVDYFGNNLIDLTSDSVTPDVLRKGVTAHDRAGNSITGAMEITSQDINPIESKQYSNVIATANTQAGGTFWFGQIHPEAWGTPWHVQYSLEILMSGQPVNGSYLGTVDLYGIGDTRQTYAIWNNFRNTSYRPIYYHPNSMVKTEALMTAGNGHLFGISLQNAYASTNKTYLRTVTLKVAKCDNCTVEVYDEPKPYNTWNSTTWGSISQLDAQNNGLREIGDDNSIDRYCLGSFTPIANGTLYGGQIVLSTDGINYFSIQTTARAVSTANVCTTQEFNPNYMLIYSSGTTINNGKRTATWTIYRSLPIDLRYSANVTEWVTHKPVYMACTYNPETGLYKLDSTKWLTQDLPTADDGKCYIYIGIAYTTASVYVEAQHPIYRMINGVLRDENYWKAYDLIKEVENGSY